MAGLTSISSFRCCVFSAAPMSHERLRASETLKIPPPSEY
jgi:hypothetical protein